MHLRDQLLERMRRAQGNVPAHVAEARVADCIAEHGRDAPLVLLGDDGLSQSDHG